MKTINTLVDDIHKTLDKEVIATEKDVEELSNSLRSMLIQRLTVKRERKVPLRLSELGSKCLRQVWYKNNHPELDKVEPRAKLNFLAGDIWEEIVLWIAKLSGHTVEGRQEKVEVEGVPGHIDSIIDGVVCDVKTANSRSVEKFKRHQLEYDDPFGYLDQVDAYSEGLKDDERVKVKGQFTFLVLDKERGELTLDTYARRKREYAKDIPRIKEIVSSSRCPPRPFLPVPDGKSGNEVLGVTCRYCPFKEHCWADANEGKGLRKFSYSNAVRWFTKVVKEPRVNEF